MRILYLTLNRMKREEQNQKKEKATARHLGTQDPLQECKIWKMIHWLFSAFG